MPQQEFVRAVCGDKVDVVVLVPPEKQSETYEPTSKEIAAFHKSSIYFAIGMPIGHKHTACGRKHEGCQTA